MWRSEYHVWGEQIHEDVVRLGLTSEILAHLGKILHIDLPVIGSRCVKNEMLVVIESSKSAIEIQSPVTGTIIQVNDKVLEDIQLLNDRPENEGWLVVVQLDQK